MPMVTPFPLEPCKGCGEDFTADSGSKNMPQQLPCSHTICHQCVLTRVGEGKQVAVPHSIFTCTEDLKNSEIKVPAVECPYGCGLYPVSREGAHSIPLDVALIQMISQGRVAQPQKDQCEECESHGAEVWCTMCCTSLCKGCFAVVHQPKTMRRHEAIPHSERPEPAEMCKMHPKQELTMYCSTHTCKVCVLCCDDRTQGEHSGDDHTVIPIEEASRGAQLRLQQQHDKMVRQLEQVKEAALKLQYVLAGLFPSYEAAVKVIEGSFAELRENLLRALSEREAALKREAKSVLERKEERVNHQVCLVADAMSHLSLACTTCKEVLGGSSRKLLDHQVSFARQLGEAVSHSEKVDLKLCDNPCIPVSFDYEAHEGFLQVVSQMGQIGVGDGPTIKVASRTDFMNVTQPAPHRLPPAEERKPQSRPLQAAGSSTTGAAGQNHQHFRSWQARHRHERRAMNRPMTEEKPLKKEDSSQKLLPRRSTAPPVAP